MTPHEAILTVINYWKGTGGVTLPQFLRALHALVGFGLDALSARAEALHESLAAEPDDRLEARARQAADALAPAADGTQRALDPSAWLEIVTLALEVVRRVLNRRAGG